MVALGIDFGTSSTAAVLRAADGSRRPLMFGASPLLPSAICVNERGEVVAGLEAVAAARARPGAFEPYPKARIDEPVLYLGTHKVPTTAAIAAVLRRVRQAASPEPPGGFDRLAVAVPATWGPTRRAVMLAAVRAAGLPPPILVPEPVAAAVACLDTPQIALLPGQSIAVYDLGAGTFDVSVVQLAGDRLRVLATAGDEEFGGRDVDQMIVDELGTVYGATHPQEWRQLTNPATAADRRDAIAFRNDVRTAKETLPLATAAEIHLPHIGREAPIGRDQLQQLMLAGIARTIDLTRGCIADAQVPAESLVAIVLVGGASRMPVVAVLLEQALGIRPALAEQPELSVAHGAAACCELQVPDVHGEFLVRPRREPEPAAIAPGSAAASTGRPRAGRAVVAAQEQTVELGEGLPAVPLRVSDRPPARRSRHVRILLMLVALAVGGTALGFGVRAGWQLVDGCDTPAPVVANSPGPDTPSRFLSPDDGAQVCRYLWVRVWISTADRELPGQTPVVSACTRDQCWSQRVYVERNGSARVKLTIGARRFSGSSAPEYTLRLDMLPADRAQELARPGSEAPAALGAVPRDRRTVCRQDVETSSCR
jgi:hypothetical protein